MKRKRSAGVQNKSRQTLDLQPKQIIFSDDLKFKSTRIEHISKVHDSDQIRDFGDFVSKFSQSDMITPWKQSWNVFLQQDGVCFYRLSRDELFTNIKISFKILVNKDMKVVIYNEETKAAASESHWVLRNTELELWSQFHRMLEHYELEPDVEVKSFPAQIQTLPNSIERNKTQTIQEVDVKQELFIAEVFVKTEDSESELNKTPAPVNKPVKPRKKITKMRPTTIKNLKSKYEKGIFHCRHCERIFETKKQRENHFFTTHDGPFYCEKCGKKLQSKSNLQLHTKRHTECIRIKCPQCDDMMFKESLPRHIRVKHQGYKPFPCSICGKLFSSMTLVKEHERIHKRKKFDGTLDDGYECPKCHKHFESGKQVFEAHLATCDGIPAEKRRAYIYPCLECGKKFMSKVTSAEHMALVHNVFIANIEKFCFECKTEVDDPLMHARSHNCAFKCTHCSFRFMSQNKLDNHVKKLHRSGEDRPFVCDICSLSFKIKNHLSSHITMKHTTSEEKRFVCNICSKRYGFQFQLNTHMASHSDFKRFACNFCDMRFKRLYTLKDHSKRIHGEINVYLCPDCPEKLKTLNDLKSHRQEQHGISINVQKYHDGFKG